MKKETIGSLFELFKISIKKMCTVRVLLPLAIFVLLTTNIIPNILTISATSIAPLVDKENASIASMIGMIGFGILAFIAYLLYVIFLYLVYLVAPTYYVSTEKHLVKADLKNIWSLIKKRRTKVLSTMSLIMLLALVAIGGAALLLFISPYLAFLVGFVVFFYLMTRFYVAMFPAIYDGFGAKKSLSISTKIMDGIKGKVAVFMGLIIVIYLVLASVILLPFGAAAYFFVSPEYLLFLTDRPITEEFMDSVTLIDYGFREIIRFVGSFINYLLMLISSGVPALLYLKRRSLAVSTN